MTKLQEELAKTVDRFHKKNPDLMVGEIIDAMDGISKKLKSALRKAA